MNKCSEAFWGEIYVPDDAANDMRSNKLHSLVLRNNLHSFLTHVENIDFVTKVIYLQ